MKIKYKRRGRHYRHADASWDWGTVDATAVTRDFINACAPYQSPPGIEDKIGRLADLIGIVADAAGINLASLIDPKDLDHEYVVDNSPDTD